MLRITRTPAAVRDLAAITDWIATDNLDAALRFYDGVDRLLSLIARYPRIGEAVDLIRVLHGARDIQSLLE
jgi:plasmid stabilization system protein ParE